MQKDFTDKVVLVTGASRGIGRAIALEFASRGAHVIINHLGTRIYTDDQEGADYVLKLIKSKNGKASIFQADITNESDLENLRAYIQSEFGKIDVLVNNAGIVFDTDYFNKTSSEWVDTLQTNLIAPFNLSKLLFPLFAKNGSIINIGSTNGLHAFSEFSADYDASKSGLIQLTKIMAQKFAEKNIRVNCVCPGWANTDMNKGLSPEYIAEVSSKIYMKRFADPTEIAKPVVFLASEEASYVTGSIIVVDGGTR